MKNEKADIIWFILLWMALLLGIALMMTGLFQRGDYDPLAFAKAQVAQDMATVAKVAQTADLAASWGIPYTLAHEIEAAAVEAGIEIPLAFALVRIESNFDSLAVSSVGARGLSQVMPSTGNWWCPGTNLFEARGNLRCGFTYLRHLLDEHTDGDLRLALLSYNRGPQRVATLTRRGVDPANGYADAVFANTF
jgi:soluble lytic murein transglycosylase-like protein